jgi:hypothetical protein
LYVSKPLRQVKRNSNAFFCCAPQGMFHAHSWRPAVVCSWNLWFNPHFIFCTWQPQYGGGFSSPNQRGGSKPLPPAHKHVGSIINSSWSCKSNSMIIELLWYGTGLLTTVSSLLNENDQEKNDAI